jgi:lantibiotic biosynthesis protein
LRSEKLNKEVLPRLTCAHNFSNNALPIYQFLCTMQTQGLRGSIGFNWGSLMENKPFLPRVRYQNTIFSSAIWNISSEDIKKIPGIRDNLFFEKVAEFKKGKKIPDKVFLVQGDNKLLIDFNHPLSVQMLFSEVKKRGFRLEEFLFVDKYPLVKRGDEVFTNQVILCFYKIKREGNG